MRKITSFLLCVLLALSLLCIPAVVTFAMDSYDTQNEETGYQIHIGDWAQLLSHTEENDLSTIMKPISAYGNVAFVSDYAPSGYDTEEYAEAYYHNHFGDSDGILFLIDMKNRYLWIYSYGEIYETITTAYANTITDNVYSYASDGDYFLCASKAFEQVNTLLEGRHIAQPMKYISNALLSIVIALMINYFLVMTLSRSRKATRSQLLNGIFSKADIKNPRTEYVKQTKHYSPQSSSSSGARSSSVGRSRGFSGGSRGGGGGHRF